MFLSDIHIINFRGIKDLVVNFDKKLNVIIGPNGSLKTTLIDVIRLFYGWGDQYNDQIITREDFFRTVSIVDGLEEEKSEKHIEICYIFKDLSDTQLGAFCDYLVIEDDDVYAEVTIEYNLSDDGHILRRYFTGKRESEQKADYDTFQLFRSYYLSALRDSTHDLMDPRNNLLGKVIKRRVEKNSHEDNISNIFIKANQQLLEQEEVEKTKVNINDNLNTILKNSSQFIDLSIAPNKIDYIVSTIKPFIPISRQNKKIDGYRLWKNSLGYNNLIYIATVLSDIKDFHESDQNTLFALFIEEPEAHLHPQLQINLYEFLKGADVENNSQIFITTHSPSLTSRIPLENIILLKDKQYCIANCFNNRATEGIVYNVKENKRIDESRCEYYRKMIIRYLDVTRSQLLFSRGALFVEGISEALLLHTLSKIMGKPLEDYEIELVNTGGVAFGQFLMLFNSSNPQKRLPIKAAFITDSDEFPNSKTAEYSLDKLVISEYQKLYELKENIESGARCNRVENMMSLKNDQPGILISSGKKTLEFQLAFANVFDTKTETISNDLYRYLEKHESQNIHMVKEFLASIDGENLSDEQKYLVALLLWKSMPPKSEFAQDFSNYLEERVAVGECNFKVPEYIQTAINFLTE